MPNGFWYAYGPRHMEEIIAGSAFSKGDLLALDSSSSVSRANPYLLSTGELYAVANADSTDSINNKCVVTEIRPGTAFWSRTTVSSTLTRGEESGVSFVAAAPGRMWVDGSTTTNVVVIDKGTAEVDQSVESKVVVRFKYADSELDLS